MDCNDARQMLWLGLLKALSHYDSRRSKLFPFARMIVKRQSMYHVRSEGNLKRYVYDDHVTVSESLPMDWKKESDRADARVMLDFIESDLRGRVTGRKPKVGTERSKTDLDVFLLLRKGHSQASAAKELGLTKEYVYKNIIKTIRAVSSKYA
jgi:DNA-directed RNA polymerase specialized sigma24 family protein